jgi:hypothetical protein
MIKLTFVRINKAIFVKESSQNKNTSTTKSEARAEVREGITVESSKKILKLQILDSETFLCEN